MGEKNPFITHGSNNVLNYVMIRQVDKKITITTILW